MMPMEKWLLISTIFFAILCAGLFFNNRDLRKQNRSYRKQLDVWAGLTGNKRDDNWSEL